MDLQTDLTLALSPTGTKTVGRTTVKDPHVTNIVDSLIDGTIADRADQSFHDFRELASGVYDHLYLTSTLTDAFGDTINFSRVKCLLVSLLGKSETGYELYVGGAVSQAWETWNKTTGAKEIVRGGGVLFRWAPGTQAFPVTASTDNLRIFNASANSVAYEIVIIGST